MLEISVAKIARVILLTREFGPESVKLTDYVSGLNDDEKASLVAVMWVGRDSFAAEELDQAPEAAHNPLLQQINDQELFQEMLHSSQNYNCAH